MKKILKRFTALLCLVTIMTLTFSDCIVAATAKTEDEQNAAQMQTDMLASIMDSLNQEDSSVAEEYPTGLFSFATVNGEVDEDNKNPLIVYIVRHGGTEGKQIVHLKFSDYSASYGKDYYAKLTDTFFSKKIKVNEDSQPLLYMFEDSSTGDGTQQAVDEESLRAAYGDEKAEEILELIQNSTSEDTKNNAAVGNTELTPDTSSDSSKDDTKQSASAAAAPLNEENLNSEIPVLSPLQEFSEGVSQYTDAGYEFTLDDVTQDEKIDERTAALGANLMDYVFPGTEADLEFKDGETVKTVYIYPIDNKTADGDRVFSMLLNGGSDTVALAEGQNAATIKVCDNEEDVTSYISIDDSSINASIDSSEQVNVTLNRRDGLYKVSTVDFKITAGDTVLSDGKAIFMPGMETKTISMKLSEVSEDSIKKLSFQLENPIGAEIEGEDSTTISIEPTALVSTVEASGSGNTKSYSKNDSPLGVSGEMAVGYFDVNMASENFSLIKKAGCKDLTYEVRDCLHLKVADHSCSCKGAYIMSQLASDVNLGAIESLDINWYYRDQDASTCNRIYIATTKNSYTDWDKCRNQVLAVAGDQEKTGVNINLRTGAAAGFKNLQNYVESQHMISNSENLVSTPQPLVFGVKKTSGGINGPELELYNLRINFRKFDITMKNPENLSGNTTLPGILKVSGNSNEKYAYQTVTFESTSPTDFAYLKGLKILDSSGKSATIDSKYFNTDTLTLDLSSDFLYQYSEYIDYKNNKINLQPVYDYKTEPITIIPDEMGGIEVNGVQYPAGSKETTIYCNVGSKLDVRTYDVKDGYYFTKYDTTVTGENGGETHEEVYSEEHTTNIVVAAGSYTITPVYTYEGTKVEINTNGTIPSGCSIAKRKYTYADDKIQVDQILTLSAKVAQGYRAKWTITSASHKWYKKVFYGDTFYFEILSGDNQISLEFEKCDNIQYVSVTGTIVGHNSSIINPPVRDIDGNYIDSYVPVSNASVQMGKFSTYTDVNGAYTFNSHSEATDSASGNNVTTYLRMGPNETHTIKVVHNGMSQVYYVQMTKDNIGENTSKDSPYQITDIESVVVDFFGKGPAPTGASTLLGSENKDDASITETMTPTIEMRDYSVGFKVDLSNVVDNEGNDLISKVNFIIYHADNTLSKSYTVEREKSGQTTYVLDSYQFVDDAGNAGKMDLNGLLDFQNGDQIYVELIGKYSGDEKNSSADNSVEYSYGTYKTGITMLEVPGEGIEIEFPDISPQSSALPVVDILGSMLPTIKLGKMSVTATISSNMMIFNIGFNIAGFNKSLYDQQESKRLAEAEAQKAKCQEELDDLEQTKDEDYEEYMRQRQEIEAEMDSIDDEPKAQQEGLNPVVNADSGETVDTNKDFTSQEINNANSTASGAIDYFDLDQKKVLAGLQNEAEKSGITKPKANSLQASGSISANLALSIGVTVRFKIMADVITGKAEWRFDQALAYAQVAGGITGVYYFVIPEFPIPLYAGASFTSSVGLYAGVQSQNKLTMEEMSGEYDKTKISFLGNIPVTLGIEGFVGVGLRSLLGMELGVGFLQKFDFMNTIGQGENIYKGTGISSFYGYAQTNVLIFNYKWKFAQVNWSYTMYDTSKEKNAAMQSMLADTSLGSDFSLDDLTVSEVPAVHYYGHDESAQSNVKSSLNYVDTAQLASGLSETVSGIADLGNGTYVAAFEGTLDKADRTQDVTDDNYQYNSRAIYISYYNGSNWSTPVILQKDGRTDTGLTVEEAGDNVVISWSSADKLFTKDMLVDKSDTAKENALLEILSSMDIYSVILKKSEVSSFVNGSISSRMSKITQITKDAEITKDAQEEINGRLEDPENNPYMGYGHEYGQSVLVGDKIYLFYSTIDYNLWKGDKKISSLSELLDADGYLLYRIYDTTTGKWIDEYAKDSSYEQYTDLGIVEGQRLADIHLVNKDDGSTILPCVGQMDAETVTVDGKEKVVVTYIVESDGSVTNDTDSNADRILYMAFMDPADIKSDGSVNKEAVWSVPLQMTDEYSNINYPQLKKTTYKGKEQLYIVWSDSTYLMYSNLTQLFDGVTSENDTNIVKGIEKDTVTLENGKTIDTYKLSKGVEPTIGIYGDDENGFQYNNGYSLSSDENGHLYAVWAQSEGTSQKLYISAMSIEEDESGNSYELWCKPKAMDWNTSQEKYYLTNPSITADKNGNIVIGHNSFELELVTEQNSEGVEVAAGKKHANDQFNVTIERAAGSAQITEQTISNSYPKAGETFDVTSVINNNGLLKADTISVKMALTAKDKNGKETVLDTKSTTLKNIEVGKESKVTHSYTMTQEMIDDTLNNETSYIVKTTVVEDNYTADAALEETAVNVGAYFEFEDISVEGYRCREVLKDKGNALTIGKETGRNRYIIHGKIVNTGNVEAKTPSFSLAASNENAFANSKMPQDDASDEEWKEYLENTPANASVVNNKDFATWISMKSFIVNDVTSIAAGESSDLILVSAKIPDEMFSELGGMSILLDVSDSAVKENTAVVSEGSDIIPVSIPEKEELTLSIRDNFEEIDNLKVDVKEQKLLSAYMMPLTAAVNNTVVWSSSDEKIVTVDAQGNVTGISDGTATITAKIKGTKISDSVKVKVGSDKYKVTLNNMNADTKGTTSVTVANNTIMPKITVPTKKGYAFGGYYTQKGGKGKQYYKADGTSATVYSELKGMTLYANWSKLSVNKVKITKVKNTSAKNTIKVEWKKLTKAKGYQITYSLKKNFKGKLYKITTAKTSKTINKLKKGKTYYIKVRGYKIDSAGKKVYGSYSKVKKIKVK